ncbi:MAG: DUF4147 domain-containing protein [Patescibacteria group bacterium]|nr:DUF4147 domain-containing protein [Patescibacteria group bacterium]
MFIKNRRALSVTDLRRDTLLVAEEGLRAIRPRNFLPQKIRLQGSLLLISGEKVDLARYRRIFVIGIGKAALDSAGYLERLLKDRITGGAVVDTRRGKLNKIKSFRGTHPLPSKQNVKAAERIIEIMKSAKKGDLILAIISGGGSALLFKPSTMSISAAKNVFRRLLDSGANINEINTVRKHISEVHGGNLIEMAGSADVLGLIFSDVPFRNLSLVASGPTFLDKTTKKDAEKIVTKYRLGKIRLSETPKDTKAFSRVKNILLLSNRDALGAMKKKAEGLGYRTVVSNSFVKGEAAEAGKKLLKRLKRGGEMILYGGETSVYVTNKNGKGGRNMDVVLGGVKYLKDNQLILSMASDGVDNIAESAGALADSLTLRKIKNSGLDPDKYLKRNNSYVFWRRIGDLIKSERTGSNVSDLMLVAQQKPFAAASASARSTADKRDKPFGEPKINKK